MENKEQWHLSTWVGNRLQQHREFQMLTFREKLQKLEQLADTAALLQRSRIKQDPEGKSGGG